MEYFQEYIKKISSKPQCTQWLTANQEDHWLRWLTDCDMTLDPNKLRGCWEDRRCGEKNSLEDKINFWASDETMRLNSGMHVKEVFVWSYWLLNFQIEEHDARVWTFHPYNL